MCKPISGQDTCFTRERGEDNADIFNVNMARAGKVEGGSEREFEEKAVQQTQINDLQQYLEKAKLGKATFKEYRGTTYQEEERAIQEEAQEDNPNLKRALASESVVYFYHPDYLSSATFLTDYEGLPYQTDAGGSSNTAKK